MIVAVSSSNHRSFHSWPQLGHLTIFCMEGTFQRNWWQERQRISISFFIKMFPPSAGFKDYRKGIIAIGYVYSQMG